MFGHPGAMMAQTDAALARYIVLTRLGDSWILRAAVEDIDSAESEAFRWRRIYGPRHTMVATCGRHPAPRSLLPMVIDVEAESVIPPDQRPTTPARRIDRTPKSSPAALGLGETCLRALSLYLGYLLATRVVDLAFAAQGIAPLS